MKIQTETQTATEIRSAAREFAHKLFVETNQTATLNLDDVSAALASIDQAMDTRVGDIPAAWGTKTIKQALADNLPEPFKSRASAQQKGMALAFWSLKETGLI